MYNRGCTFWDTANVYKDSEVLIGKWFVLHLVPKAYTVFTLQKCLLLSLCLLFSSACRFKETGKRKEIFLATKFGIASPHKKGVDGRPEYVAEACETSMKRLGVDQIDLYYLHR